MKTRLLTLGLVLTLGVACSTTTDGGATSGTTVFCYRRLKLDGGSPLCECSATEESRSASDFEKVASCDEAPKSFCCSDVDTNGEAKSCLCWRARCYRDRKLGRCACGNGYDKSFFLDPSEAEEVSSCDDISGFRCCGGGLTGCWCSADLDGESCDGSRDQKPVTTCRASEFVPTECVGEKISASCNDITFKPPPPPSSGGGSEDEDECKYDGDCSSDCSTDCYGCRSGRCKCGRRGVSGGCLL